MALGAVFFGLPFALFFGLYGYAIQNLSLTSGLLVYMATGTSILLSYTLIHGFRYEDYH
jgi:hypothetical protein